MLRRPLPLPLPGGKGSSNLDNAARSAPPDCKCDSCLRMGDLIRPLTQQRCQPKRLISALGDTPWRHSVTTVATGGHGRSSRRVRRRRRSSLVVARREHPRRAWTPRCRSPHEYTLQAPSYSHRLRRNDEVDALKDDGEPGHRRRKRGLAGQGLELQDLLTAV